VAVIGAGVFGAWIAWHLQRAGQRVLLVDQYGPASSRASSGGESRVIRASYGPDAIYTRMAQHSLALWRQFFAAVGRPELFQRTGTLWMAHAGDEAALASVACLAGAGVPHEVLTGADIARRFPQVAVPADGWAIFEPDSGALMARRAVQSVVGDAVRAGAEFRAASALPVRGAGRLDAVEVRSGMPISADRFVFACGPWLGAVLPDALAGRIFPTRQEVHYFGVPAGDPRFAPPLMPAWMDFDRQWYGIPDLEARGFKVAHDAHGPPIDPDTAERAPDPDGVARARAFLAQRFPALAGAPLLATEVCQYENTSNGDLVLDRHPAFDNVWIAGGGSGHGFKHGPAVGEYVAERMLRGGAVDARFSLATKRDSQRREVH
jgi:monomeric sarcosine oxidase